MYYLPLPYNNDVLKNVKFIPVRIMNIYMLKYINKSEVAMIKNKEKIINTLTSGGVITYVTDTVWGLGCLPDNENAVKKIYDIKKREAQKPLILMSNEYTTCSVM